MFYNQKIRYDCKAKTPTDSVNLIVFMYNHVYVLYL